MSSTAAQKNILAAKEKGNTCVQRCDYQQAIIEYTKGIDSTPQAARTAANSFHFLFGNRSLCYFELKQYQDAYDDATRALDVNPKYGKGWLRLALVERALQIDPVATGMHFEDVKLFEPSLSKECDKYMTEQTMLHNSQLFLQMTSFNNTWSLLQQIWMHSGFKQKVKEYLTKRRMSLDYVREVCSVLTENEQSLDALRRAMANQQQQHQGASDEDDFEGCTSRFEIPAGSDGHIVQSLMPDWRVMRTVEELMAEIDSKMTGHPTGFELLHCFVCTVENTMRKAHHQRKTIPANQLGVNRFMYDWFLKRVDYDHDEEYMRVPNSLAINSKVAREHFLKFQFVLSVSGMLLKAHEATKPAELLILDKMERNVTVIPIRNQRVAFRAAEIFLFRILLPLFENWMNELYPTEEKRAELPKNIVDHFFNFDKVSDASSLQSLLQDDGGVCACCLKPFIADKKTKSHYDPVSCSSCNSVFYCSAACRDMAAKENGHNTKDKKQVACTGKVSDHALQWKNDFYGKECGKRFVVARPRS